MRYWTAGGALRDVPVGAGRRKSKMTRSYDGGEPSGAAPAGGAAGVLQAPLGLDPLTAFGLATAPPPLLPGRIVLPVPAPGSLNLDSNTVAAAATIVAEALIHPAAAAQPPPPAQQQQAQAQQQAQQAQQQLKVDSDLVAGGIDGMGRRTRSKLDHEPAGAVAAVSGAPSGMAVGGLAGGPGPVAVSMPYNVAMDWFAAAGQNPQAAAAMQAQLQAGYGQPPFHSVPGMWPMQMPYTPFPPGWAAPYPAFHGFGTVDPAAAAAAAAAATGGFPSQVMAPPDGAVTAGAAMMTMQGNNLQWGGVPPGAWTTGALPPAIPMPPSAPVVTLALPGSTPMVPMVPPLAAPPAANGAPILEKTPNE
jgi:hypothetical protein